MFHLKEGDKAPDFNITDQNGKVHHIADYSGKKLILYFYPKDNTPGCTVQSCNLSSNYETLQKEGFEVLGVSADTEKKHQGFINKFNLAFNLLADTEREVLTKYGVWGEKKFMGKTYDGIHRTTFVIDENGIIVKIINKVKTKDHTQQILDSLELA